LGATLKHLHGQKKGCISGREGVFKVTGQDKERFSGRVSGKQKETPSKECFCNISTITRRFSAASSASARCSQNIEAAGTPSPILLPQAAALQKPTGMFADRLRP